MSPDEIFHFLETLSGNLSKATRRLRYAQMKAFYNFIIDRCSLNWRNPCNTTLLSKSFFYSFSGCRHIMEYSLWIALTGKTAWARRMV